MVGVYVALFGLGLTILGLIVKITVFSTEIRIWVDEMRKDRKAIRRFPLVEMRVATIEKRLGIVPPEVPDTFDAE